MTDHTNIVEIGDYILFPCRVASNNPTPKYIHAICDKKHLDKIKRNKWVFKSYKQKRYNMNGQYVLSEKANIPITDYLFPSIQKVDYKNGMVTDLREANLALSIFKCRKKGQVSVTEIKVKKKFSKKWKVKRKIGKVVGGKYYSNSLVKHFQYKSDAKKFAEEVASMTPNEVLEYIQKNKKKKGTLTYAQLYGKEAVVSNKELAQISHRHDIYGTSDSFFE